MSHWGPANLVQNRSVFYHSLSSYTSENCCHVRLWCQCYPWCPFQVSLAIWASFILSALQHDYDCHNGSMHNNLGAILMPISLRDQDILIITNRSCTWSDSWFHLVHFYQLPILSADTEEEQSPSNFPTCVPSRNDILPSKIFCLIILLNGFQYWHCPISYHIEWEALREPDGEIFYWNWDSVCKTNPVVPLIEQNGRIGTRAQIIIGMQVVHISQMKHFYKLLLYTWLIRLVSKYASPSGRRSGMDCGII